jgi:hypothetical protein
MRPIGILSLGVFAACASSQPATRAGATESVHISGTGARVSSTRIAPSVTTSSVSLSFPLDSVWRALPATYESLGIAISDFDEKTHVIGNSGLKIRRRLGTTALSRYLDCGNTQMGPSADDYQINLSVLTQLSPGDSGRTVLTTNVDATAQGLQFAQQAVRCTSKGTIEARIVELVKGRLWPW